MTSLKILHTDPLLEHIRQNQDGVAITQTSPQFKFRVIPPATLEATNEILANSGNSYTYSSFSFSTDNKVTIDQIVNYNAPEYFEQIQNSNLFNIQKELYTTSIYQTTLDDNAFFVNNFTRDVFLDTTILFPVPPFTNRQVLSIDPTLSTAATAEYKSVFPNIVNFSFPAIVGSSSDVLEIFNEYNVYYGLVEFLNNAATPSTTFFESDGGVEYEVYDASSIVNGIPNNFDQATVTHIGDYQDTFFDQQFDNLERYLFTIDMNNKAKEKAIKFQELMSSESSVKNEIICYRIDKYNSQQQLIQTFFTPAIDGYRNFIDTQIIYNNSYVYDVHAIVAAYGTDYSWEAISAGNYLEITVTSETPAIRLFKIRISTTEVPIQAFAPPKPDVMFFNRSDQEKTLRFYFEPNKHEIKEKFIPIEEQDETEQAGVNLLNNMIFKQTDLPLSYEIYKLNRKPTSYLDFRDNLYTTIESTVSSNSRLYEMYLTPNKKFYFTFRSRNEFGLVSNPTAIYEIELIKDSDETSVVSKIVNMKEPESKTVRTFGRFLRIYPAFEQITLNEFTNLSPADISQLGFENYNYYVGDTESPIWGRKFKFRVRSRNTGKIVDLNVDFVLNKVESEEI